MSFNLPSGWPLVKTRLPLDEYPVFFWSDLHLRHDREFVWKDRGFKNVQDHDNELKRRWNTTIEPNAIVYLLGDTIFGHGAEEEYFRIFGELNFDTLFLMGGNHDAGWRNLAKTYSFNPIKTCGKTIYIAPNILEVTARKQFIVLSHYPIGSWNHQSSGGWNIHGHCHGNFAHDFGKHLDVGVEKCPYPVTVADMKKILDKKSTVVNDHH